MGSAGLAINLETAFKEIGIDMNRYEVDELPDADWYFFVQQGQLHSFSITRIFEAIYCRKVFALLRTFIKKL